MKSLVGYTGFVGSNLNKQDRFDNVYNSKNISDAYDTKPELLVYAGVRAEKFLANQNKEADFQQIKIAFNNIKKINPRKLVLISTVDVYKNPNNVDEHSEIELENLHPYGYNRFLLEKMVRDEYPDSLIIRLPGLFGDNLKKNFIYDLIHVIPSMLSESKYKELCVISNLISKNYEKSEGGFYKCKSLDQNEKKELKKEFLNCGFSSLNFTDSRGKFQFYNLAYLYDHIKIALNNNIRIMNMATEPIDVSAIYHELYHEEFMNILDKPIPNYNFKTIYSELYEGRDGYIFNKDQVMSDIMQYIREQLK